MSQLDLGWWLYLLNYILWRWLAFRWLGFGRLNFPYRLSYLWLCFCILDQGLSRVGRRLIITIFTVIFTIIIRRRARYDWRRLIFFLDLLAFVGHFLIHLYFPFPLLQHLCALKVKRIVSELFMLSQTMAHASCFLSTDFTTLKFLVGNLKACAPRTYNWKIIFWLWVNFFRPLKLVHVNHISHVIKRLQNILLQFLQTVKL